jgi:hypothetical protein
VFGKGEDGAEGLDGSETEELPFDTYEYPEALVDGVPTLEFEKGVEFSLSVNVV